MKNKKFQESKPTPPPEPARKLQLSVGAALSLGDGHTFASTFEAPVSDPAAFTPADWQMTVQLLAVKAFEQAANDLRKYYATKPKKTGE